MALGPNKSRLAFRSLRSTFHCWSLFVTAHHHFGANKLVATSSFSHHTVAQPLAKYLRKRVADLPTYAYSNKFPAKERETIKSTTQMSEIWQVPSLVFQKMPLSAILASAELSPPRSHAPSNIKNPRTTPTRRSLRHDCEAPLMGWQNIWECHELVREEVYICYRVSTNCFAARPAFYIFPLKSSFSCPAQARMLDPVPSVEAPGEAVPSSRHQPAITQAML